MRNRTLTLGALTLVVGLVMVTGSATAITSDNSENGTLTVDVSSKTAIDVSPADLSYTGSGDGTQPEPGSTVNTSDTGYTAVEIENIGSSNLTEVWLNASTTQTNPFGSGTGSGYDAGNFIQVNGTGEIPGVAGPDTGFTYINRKDFNETNDLSYVFTPNDGFQWNYGRLRAGDQEFFWAVNTTECSDGTSATNEFRVGNKPHNKTATGSTDFTSSGDWTGYELTSKTGNGNNYGFATGVSYDLPNGETRQYDILTYCGSSKSYTLRGKYNPKMGGTTNLKPDGTNIGYLVNSSDKEEQLQPGEHFRVDTRLEVPFGVPSTGQLSGTLRVLTRSSP